jgi:RimJ/RimL family protein N-acetyltransferase
VNPKQKAAVKLYEKCGFKTVGVLKKELYVNGKFYDELIMEKYI